MLEIMAMYHKYGTANPHTAVFPYWCWCFLAYLDPSSNRCWACKIIPQSGSPPWAKSTRNPTPPGIDSTTAFTTGTRHGIWAIVVVVPTWGMTASYK
jgi:hypothetical protein